MFCLISHDLGSLASSLQALRFEREVRCETRAAHQRRRRRTLSSTASINAPRNTYLLRRNTLRWAHRGAAQRRVVARGERKPPGNREFPRSASRAARPRRCSFGATKGPPLRSFRKSNLARAARRRPRARLRVYEQPAGYDDGAHGRPPRAAPPKEDGLRLRRGLRTRRRGPAPAALPAAARGGGRARRDPRRGRAAAPAPRDAFKMPMRSV